MFKHMVKFYKIILPNEKGNYVLPKEDAGKQYLIKNERLFVITEVGSNEKVSVEVIEGLA